MEIVSASLNLIPGILIGIYTVNYGRWAWRKRLYRGAVGLYLLAIASAVMPGFVMWVHM